METTKKTTAKKKIISDDVIIEKYMNLVLENNKEPKNIFTFCKDSKLEEADFYVHFSSIESLQKEIWNKFFENALSTIEKNEDYKSYTNKNKLLTLYFTLFEIVNLNRSYVVFALGSGKNDLKKLKTLKGFRKMLKEFVQNIVDDDMTILNEQVAKVTKPIYAEGAWIQFLFLLKFWLDDESKGFEKTDILIEKSVNTVVDLLNTKPLESLFDLGKFLFKERRN